MKYFLIAGEPSGDLHASNLMRALMQADPEAQFRFYGGDKMKAVGGTLLRHYRTIAYMGFIPVILHARTILNAMKECRRQIVEWHPDVLILIDYPGFNLKIAEYVKTHTNIPIHYYIPPKIWAWKEHRIKDIKRNVDQIFSILPFEVPFYTQKHNYPINYVGNPSLDEISHWQAEYTDTHKEFLEKHNLPDLPVIAVLPGSRRQEIKDNLTRMIAAALPYTQKGYQIVVAATLDIEDNFYHEHIGRIANGNDSNIHVIRNCTFEILANSEVGIITSGTATLETALFRVPQIVCYYTSMGKLIALLRKLFLKVKYISLVNLIVDRQLVPELVGDQMNVSNIQHHLATIIRGGSTRNTQQRGYEEMAKRLGKTGAPERAANLIVENIKASVQK